MKLTKAFDKTLRTMYNKIEEVKYLTRKFIMVQEFLKAWERMSLTDDDLKELQTELLKNPACGDLMQGTNGCRKMRISLEGRGKSGGARVIYVDFVMRETIYLLTAYPKSEKANLTKEERNDIKKLVAELEREGKCI